MYKIVNTSDGSSTVRSSRFAATFHSTFGAVQESQHVFIDSGLAYLCHLNEHSSIRILEYGFGTGLNAFMTALYSIDHNIQIDYTGIEAFPLPDQLYEKLDYSNHLDHGDIYAKIYKTKWNEEVEITPLFKLNKIKSTFENYCTSDKYHLVYYDAFGPGVQSHLWENQIHSVIYSHIEKGGTMVTYCAQGNFRRMLLELGYEVERLKGPPGKRHMIRARKV